ncbi:MAG: LysR family transcriptional regulator [Clostridia bacterium]|nr:LysR family transcriptional regulator [Clostridia bacterium]
MNTKQLRYLLTIEQFGNLSAAAAALGISQPALSKALHEWEESFGFELFLRYNRKLMPTAVGRQIIEYAQKILDEQSQMMLTLQNLEEQDRKVIRLCTAPNRAAIIYSHVYQDFSRHFPGIALQLVERYASEQPAAVRRGQVDLALGAGPMSEEVSDIPFAREELLLALPASHPLAGQKQVALTQLKDTPFALQGRKHSIRSIVDTLFEQAGYLPVIAFESNDVFLLDAMLHKAIGAGFVSKIHVFPCEDLVYLSLDPPVYQMTHIRYPLDHELTDAEKFLAGLLIRHRLNDERYEAIPSACTSELLSRVNAGEQAAQASVVRESGDHEVQEINLEPQILLYMIGIVEEGGLMAAAERYYLSQPALSRYLRQMEKMLGVRLFSRQHNRLEPTNAGKIFINSARNILRFESEMEKSIEKYRKGHGGHICIACNSMIARYFLAHTQSVFEQDCPEMRLALVRDSSKQIQEDLLNASADIGLYFTNTRKQKDLHQEVLASCHWRYCPAKGKGLPQAEEKVRIMLGMDGTELRQEQELVLADLFESPPHVVGQAELQILLEMLESGMADTLLPEDFLREAQREKSICLEDHEVHLVLAINPSRMLPEPAKRLMDIIRSQFTDSISAICAFSCRGDS